MHIGLDNESHHNVEETNVIDKKDDNEEELPSKMLLILDQRCNIDTPRLTRSKLIKQD